jgi:hypothetical protein
MLGDATRTNHWWSEGPTELRKLEKNLISFGEAERDRNGRKALVAISHCMSLQTAGQESNRTTVFWWWVHSMLGNDFDIFWWVIYSAKFNFDLMPVILWRLLKVCVSVDWFGCHSRVTVVSVSRRFWSPFRTNRCEFRQLQLKKRWGFLAIAMSRLKRKSDGKGWIWRFWMLIIIYNYNL